MSVKNSRCGMMMDASPATGQPAMRSRLEKLRDEFQHRLLLERKRQMALITNARKIVEKERRRSLKRYEHTPRSATKAYSRGRRYSGAKRHSLHGQEVVESDMPVRELLKQNRDKSFARDSLNPHDALPPIANHHIPQNIVEHNTGRSESPEDADVEASSAHEVYDEPVLANYTPVRRNNRYKNARSPIMVDEHDDDLYSSSKSATPVVTTPDTVVDRSRPTSSSLVSRQGPANPPTKRDHAREVSGNAGTKRVSKWQRKEAERKAREESRREQMEARKKRRDEMHKQYMAQRAAERAAEEASEAGEDIVVEAKENSSVDVGQGEDVSVPSASCVVADVQDVSTRGLNDQAYILESTPGESLTNGGPAVINDAAMNSPIPDDADHQATFSAAHTGDFHASHGDFHASRGDTTPFSPKPPSTPKQSTGARRNIRRRHPVTPRAQASRDEDQGGAEDGSGVNSTQVRRVPSPVASAAAATNVSMFGGEPGDEEVQLKLVPCGICGRKFAEERLVKHEAVCKKASAAKRTKFDPSKARLQGTEAAQFAKSKDATDAKYQKKLKKANWKAKSEAFRAAMRAAKNPNAAPAPPMENPDLVPCPHCGRKFSDSAAERHIPRCREQAAKPKVTPKGRARKKYDPRAHLK